MSDKPATNTISVTLNGEPRQLPEGLHVAALLRHLGIHARAVAVERNRAIVRRANHETTTIEADDMIEIVSFVGGG